MIPLTFFVLQDNLKPILEAKKGRYSLQSKIISAFEVNSIGFLYTYVLHFFPDFSELYGWSKEEKKHNKHPTGPL